MLPPGLLERLELVAELDAGRADAARTGLRRGRRGPPRAARRRRAAGPRPRRAGRAGRPAAAPAGARGRRARSASTGPCSGPAAVRATSAGSGSRRGPAAAATWRPAGGRPGGRSVRARSRRSRDSLPARPAEGCRRPSLAGRHGADRRSPASSAAAWSRPRSASVPDGRWPRDPPACAAAGRRRPSCRRPRPRPSSAIRAAIAAGDPTPLLLDGVTGGGKTAVYVEAIATALEAGRPALVLVPEIALALPLVDRLRADLDVRVALVHSGLGDGERADEWRRIRAGDVDVVVGTRLAVLAPLADRRGRHRRRGARRRLQERPDAAAPGPRRGDPPGRARPAPPSCSGRRRRPWTASAAPGPGDYRRVELPTRPVGAAPDRRDRRPARGARGGRARPAVAAAGRGARRARPGGRRPGHPRPQPARHRVGRPVPRLRPRPGLPGLRAAARLPPGRHDAALPPLRPGHADRDPLSGLRLAADPVPRRRHRTRRARGPRRASRRSASAASIATSSSARARRSASSTRSRRVAWTSSSARASWPRASTSRR